MRRQIAYGLVAALLPALAGPAIAADQDRTGDQSQTRQQQQLRDQDIYGHQLMTEQERNAYRERMRATKTEQEREQIRREHHEQMKQRAQERGVTLPDEPPPRGTGRGMGPGGAQGAGSSKGAGGGRGRNY